MINVKPCVSVLEGLEMGMVSRRRENTPTEYSKHFEIHIPRRGNGLISFRPETSFLGAGRVAAPDSGKRFGKQGIARDPCFSAPEWLGFH